MSTSYMIFSPSQETNTSLTPPIDTTSHRRKSSVTFDLPPTENNIEEELLSPCTVVSPTIDITAQIVPDSMLVALFDRSSEMKGLVRHNKAFFTSLQQHLDSKWPRFENTLYCDRSKMSDKEWLKRISKALHAVPSLLEKFKELVGYLGPEEKEEKEDYFSNVDISLIRNYPDRLSRESYPQFFINCKESIQGDKEFDDFVNTLLNSNKDDISDKVWEAKVYQVFNQHPNLLEQLQEIVAYEMEV